MKRFSCTFLLISLLCTFATAADKEFSGWGLRGSLDITMPTKWKVDGQDAIKMYSPGAGATIGVVYNAELGNNFYLEPGVGLYYDTYKYSDLAIAMPDGSLATSTDASVKKAGIRVPLMLGYRIFFPSDFSLALYTGPEVSYCFSARAGYGKEITDLAGLDTNLFNGGMRRYDCGWKVGVGVPIGRWVVALDYTFGLVDQCTYPASYREQRLSLTLGYDF